VNRSRRKSVLVLLAMASAAGLAVAARPTKRVAESQPRLDLERMIPRSFAGWRVDPSILPILPAPDVQARLDRLYDQTLARTYVNASGERVMLSIAYGADQAGETTQLHRPEFCYRSQGFDVSGGTDEALASGHGEIRVRRLVAQTASRVEPITYWITVGDEATLPGVGRKLAQIRYGLTGRVPDGLLFRVSSLSRSSRDAYRLQDAFITDLLDAVDAQQRIRLVGSGHRG
jgi:EpsI family protein